MIYNGKEVEFPAVMQLSLFKLIESLENTAKEADEDTKTYIQSLLKLVEEHPEIKEGFPYEDIHKFIEPIRRLTKNLFPEALLSNEIKALTPPFHFDPIVTSTRLDNIIKSSGTDFSLDMKDVDEDTFYLYCCYFILASYYGYPVPSGGSWTVEIFNKNQGLMRTYKMLINVDMCEFVPTKKAIEITQSDFAELLDNFGDIDLWKKKFPPNSWIMRGINMVSLVDVTPDQSISTITSNLLVKSTDTFEKIRGGLRTLLNNAVLDVGVLTLDRNKLVPLNKHDTKSILLQPGEALHCDADMCDYTRQQLIKHRQPLVMSDVRGFDQEAQGGLSAKIAASDYESYIIAPLVHENKLIGFLELASKKKYELNKGTLQALDEILPILAMAQSRFMSEAQNRIEAIIQQECTTIHPSVKWKFEEEAEKFMVTEFSGGEAIFKDIVFDHLYPLYGQLDIKGSSTTRNDAVSTDLIKQINGVKKVLKKAITLTNMPVFEELIFRLDTFKSDLKKGLSAGSEHKVLSFLKSDIYPVFNFLKSKDQECALLVEEYSTMLDPELLTVYEERKKYDTSVNIINQRLANYLDKKQEEAQGMFPHYFERYKTDGVEYNMYIGQSIARDDQFDMVHLRNLRIWQLLVMCEMENEFKNLQPELAMPLEVASLILVYNTPLSVHFRMDEKQFDVEGAYNARYEIIKKRVDKALIKGTNERITQPRKIAIIYSQEQDANEYRQYLKFLASKGFVKKEFEDLKLEDLQGVSGLRALRVEVNYGSSVSVDELIKSIEAESAN